VRLYELAECIVNGKLVSIPQRVRCGGPAKMGLGLRIESFNSPEGKVRPLRCHHSIRLYALICVIIRRLFLRPLHMPKKCVGDFAVLQVGESWPTLSATDTLLSSETSRTEVVETGLERITIRLAAQMPPNHRRTLSFIGYMAVTSF